jgi:hypothetical protein
MSKAERSEAAKRTIDQLVAALRPFAEQRVDDAMNCHSGITTKEKCGRCSAIMAARHAITEADK